MSEKLKNTDYTSNENEIKDILLRYLSFWPTFLFFIFSFLIIAFIYLRYADYQYESYAKIEIIDKSQDSEMVLPSAMTVFNRSMINLENEVGVLSSFSLHQRVVRTLNSNIKFFSVGRIKTTENYYLDWYPDFKFDLNINPDTISTLESYHIYRDDNKLIIEQFNFLDELVKKYSFQGKSTFNSKHDLPFELNIIKDNDVDTKKIVEFHPFDDIVDYYIDLVKIKESGPESDQLDLSLRYPDSEIANDYINTLLSEFDKDGISDRQSEHKRTIEFVDSRSVFLNNELEQIELNKQEFKEKNNLTDIETDANINVNQQISYNAELFKARSQKDLIILLKGALENNEYKLMPVDIGLENSNINSLIIEYNLKVNERDRYLISAGRNNSFVKNLEKQLSSYSENIFKSIENHERNLAVTINNLELKEKEFSNIYSNIPENEKILRSIERELKVKEALFLLLLQKREEAAINFAVVKPSIKIIDSSRSSIYPVTPNKGIIYFSAFILGLAVPFGILALWFMLDTKIHTREQLLNRIKNVPIVGEIPHIINNDDLKEIIPSNSRHPLAESIRMVVANLNFILFNDSNKKNNLILVTSSIKGEGKTIVSVNIASILSSKYDKVLLLGADLRNPQIHKFLNISKTVKGLSDFIYTLDQNWKKHIIKRDNIDILLSGTIPPNPTELLSSNKFSKFIDHIKNEYDYIVIDSAPCLLVSDTFEISKYVDTTLYVVRSNFSELKLIDFIRECSLEKKLSNINLILNSVGNSRSYGYKYGYQYGYKYGYKYGYNYGYGYGYLEEK